MKLNVTVDSFEGVFDWQVVDELRILNELYELRNLLVWNEVHAVVS